MATKTVQDSSLSAIADAIRAKTGKSASMEFPTEFVSEIGSISGGGSTDVTFHSDNSTFNSLFPDLDGAGIKTLTIYVDYWTNRQAPSYLPNINVQTINLKYATGLVPNSLRDCFRGGLPSRMGGTTAHKLRTINLVNVDTSAVKDWFSAFNSSVNNVTINGILDLSSYSSGNPFNGGSGFKELRFQPNALGVGMTISNGQQTTWSDATWVSFANNLKAGITATLTIGSTAQNRLASIMGTVSDGTFTLDSGGSVSLQSFITSTKGWTLA